MDFNVIECLHARRTSLHALVTYACVCTDYRKKTERYILYLRDLEADTARYRWETLAEDEQLWGPPYMYYPLPSWRQWRLQVWWYVVNRSSRRLGWIMAHEDWIRSLHDMQNAMTRAPTTGGLYSHIVVQIDPWTWDYEDRVWVPEDHI